MSGEIHGEDDPTFGSFNRLLRLTDHDDVNRPGFAGDPNS